MFSGDSVFSQFIAPKFSKENSSFIGEATLHAELDKIEKPTSELLVKTYRTQIEASVDFLSKAIAEGNYQLIDNYRWGLNIGITNKLWGEWLLGWDKGREHGNNEVSSVANFAQPEADWGMIRNRPAEAAIKTRVNTLAGDVGDSEWELIKGDILDTIKPLSPTQSPISRRELLNRINARLGDRANRFKNRAEGIARTELTFAYNAGRLDSYVRSGLVAGVEHITILDDRRCPMCESRHGIIVALDDIEGLAELALPVHPRCRCVWSPILKTEFDTKSKPKGRQLKHRKILPGKPWLVGGIMAAILIPEELIGLGLIAAGFKALIAKAGSAKAARAAVAMQLERAIKGKPATTKANTQDDTSPRMNSGDTSLQVVPSKYKTSPIIIVGNLDLQNATIEQIKTVVPTFTQGQMENLEQLRRQGKLENLNQFLVLLEPQQAKLVKAIARQNHLLNLLHPKNNPNPSAVWVNSGGIISKKQAKAVHKIINNNSFDSVAELLQALKKQGVDTERLYSYARNLFDRNYI